MHLFLFYVRVCPCAALVCVLRRLTRAHAQTNKDDGGELSDKAFNALFWIIILILGVPSVIVLYGDRHLHVMMTHVVDW